jgi:hypothetical protein
MTRFLFAAMLSVGACVAVPASVCVAQVRHEGVAARMRAAAAVPPKTTATITAASTLSTTGSFSIKVVNPQINTLSGVTCATLDADGSTCDASPSVALGTSVASFAITGSPNPYTGTPTLTDPSGNFKISGGNIVPAKTPIPAGTYTLTIVP